MLDSPLLARTKGRNAMEVLMEPNRLMSTMFRKSSMVLHSISDHSEIPALFTTAHRPEVRGNIKSSESEVTSGLLMGHVSDPADLISAGSEPSNLSPRI